MNDEIKSTNLSQFEFLLVETGSVDLFPYSNEREIDKLSLSSENYEEGNWKLTECFQLSERHQQPLGSHPDKSKSSRAVPNLKY
jgi:hypothetical protein